MGRFLQRCIWSHENLGGGSAQAKRQQVFEMVFNPKRQRYAFRSGIPPFAAAKMIFFSRCGWKFTARNGINHVSG